MKVAINSGPLTSGHSVRGVGVYTRELTRSLDEKTKKIKNLKIDTFDFSTDHQSLTTNHYDIVHYPYFHPFFVTLPIKKTSKVVVTVHDLIPLIYPKHYPPGLKGKIRFLIQKFLLKNVDMIITDTETSKKDACRFLGVDPYKVKVIYLAPRRIFRKLPFPSSLLRRRIQKYNLPLKFVLYVGDVNYSKNIISLIKACEIAGLPLVVVGKHAQEVESKMNIVPFAGPRDWLRYLLGKSHPEIAHYQELARVFKEDKNVLRLGFVPDEDLAAIYNLATVYCQPSFYEGFGLPILEAMACNTPVVVAKTNALVEIGGGAVLVADAKDPKDIADKIAKLLKNTSLRVSLIREGTNRVKEFDWEKTAKETIEVYKSVVSG